MEARWTGMQQDRKVHSQTDKWTALKKCFAKVNIGTDLLDGALPLPWNQSQNCYPILICMYNILVACTRRYIPLCRSVHRSVHPSVRPSIRPSVLQILLFWHLWGFWPCCSCPNAPLTSIMAPAHPHAIGVAVYPALFFTNTKIF